MKRWGTLVVPIIAGILVLDQVTKTWALRALDDGRIIELFWTLQFNLAFNTGMAFSRGGGMGPVIGVISMAVVVVLLVTMRRHQSRATVVAGATVVGGALGNVVDRLFRGDAWLRGAVVDFIDLQWWPIFNVADTAVVLGGIALAAALSRRSAT